MGMTHLELAVLRQLHLPEQPSLLRIARLYGPRAWWPTRYRRRSRNRLLKAVFRTNVPLKDWVCHELHLRGHQSPEVELSKWLRTRVLPDRRDQHDACAVSVQQKKGRLVVVVVFASVTEQGTE